MNNKLRSTLVTLTALLAIVAFLPSGVVGAQTPNNLGVQSPVIGQLESNPNFPGTDLVLNGGLNTFLSPTSKIPRHWSTVNFSPTDGKDTLHKKEGAAAVTIAFNGSKTKWLFQNRAVGGLVGDSFQLSLWYRCAKSSLTPTAPPPVSSAKVTFSLGVTIPQTVKLNLWHGGSCAGNWVAGSTIFTATSSYDMINISLICKGGKGQCSFDGVKLLRAP